MVGYKESFGFCGRKEKEQLELTHKRKRRNNASVYGNKEEEEDEEKEESL